MKRGNEKSKTMIERRMDSLRSAYTSGEKSARKQFKDVAMTGLIETFRAVGLDETAHDLEEIQKKSRTQGDILPYNLPLAAIKRGLSHDLTRIGQTNPAGEGDRPAETILRTANAHPKGTEV